MTGLAQPAPVMDPCKGYLLGKYERRFSPLRALVIHTTGSGLIARFRDDQDKYGWKSVFECAVWYFRTIGLDGYHYLFGQGGEEVQLCPEELCVWHVGAKDKWWRTGAAKIYSKPLNKWEMPGKTDWWRRRWPAMASPLDLGDAHIWDRYPQRPKRLKTAFLSRKGSINANTMAFGIVPDALGRGTKYPWSDACWNRIISRAHDVATRRELGLHRFTVCTHSDVHPRARSARNRPWDPGERQWSWEEFRRRSADYLRSRR